MEHNSENEEVVQSISRSGVIKTVKPLFNKPSILRDVTEGIHPYFNEPYIRTVRFLEGEQDFTFPMYVTKEEAERMAAPITECPLCDAGVPLSK